MLRSMRDIVQAAEQVREAQREWQEVARDVEPRPDVAERFMAACEAILRDATSVARRRAEADHVKFALEEGLAARAALCERVEALEGADGARALADARAEWSALPPLSDEQDAVLRQRFTRAGERAAARHQDWLAAEALRTELETLVAEAEALAEVSPPPAAKRWKMLESRWESRAARAVEPLARRFAAAGQRLQQRWQEAEQRRASLERKNLTHLEALCTRLLEMARSETLKPSAGRRDLQAANAALADLGPLPPSERRAAWTARLSEARDELLRRLSRDEQTEEWRRWANVGAQEALIARVEALLESNDLAEGTRQLGRLQDEWAQVATASPDKAKGLWERFRTARNELRKRCDAYQAANLEQKRVLCAQAAELGDSTAWNETPELIRRLQARWKEIGPVPARHATALWREFREPCDRFFARRQEQFDHLDAERREHAKAKTALCEQAEALADSTDWDATATAMKQLQAEWKRTGPAPRHEADALWHRFRTACDRFFDRRNRREEVAREDAVRSARAICDELESLGSSLSSGEDAPEADRIGAQIDEAWSTWLRLDVGTLDGAQQLSARLQAACEGIAAARPESLQRTRLDPEMTRARREKLCARLEALVAPDPEPARALSPQEMALALRERLAANTIGGGANQDARKQDVRRDVERISASWAHLGPVLGDDARALADRFARALARVRDSSA